MDGTALYARRFEAEYRLPRNHPDPAGVRADLDSRVLGALRESLGDAVAERLRPSDEGVCLIRRLEVNVDLNTSQEAELLSRVWAARIAAALRRTLDGEGDPSNIVRFPSRGAHLARFFIDSIDGCAFDRWYHRVFSGLMLLPASAAVRTAIDRDPVAGRQALLHLPPGDLDRVVGSLSANDSRAVIRILAPSTGETESGVFHEILIEAVELLASLRPRALSEDQLALRLHVEISRLPPATGGSVPGDLVAAVARWLRLRIAPPATKPPDLKKALASGDAGVLRQACPAEDLPLLLPLLGAPGNLLERLDRAGARLRGEATEPSPGKEVLHATPFGGVFLLLPHLLRIPLDSHLGDLPPVENVPLPQLFLFLIAIRCLGKDHFATAIEDPTLRMLFGIPGETDSPATLRRLRDVAGTILPPLDRAMAEHRRLFESRSPERAARDWLQLGPPGGWEAGSELEERTRTCARRVLRSFASNLPGFAGSSVDHLLVNFLAVRATIEEGEDRRVVRLSRPPLHLILSMTGADRASYTLPWLDRRPFVLFPEATP